jgi:hypothetical protein
MKNINLKLLLQVDSKIWSHIHSQTRVQLELQPCLKFESQLRFHIYSQLDSPTIRQLKNRV